MRKVCSVICHVVAGFLFYLVSLLGFISAFPPAGKALMVAGFLVAALVAMAIGLAFTGFRRWKRDAGLVLLWTSGVNAFLVLTMVCLMMSEEFSKLMPVDTVALFGSYVVGALLMAALAVAGWLLFQAGERPAAAMQP